MNRKFIWTFITLIGFGLAGKAQSTTGSNIVQTAVQFLSIAPDSRAGAMGDAGAATTPDVNSLHWNPAKYAFIESQSGVALSYTPWLRSLVHDMNIAYLVGYNKLDEMQTLSAGLTYFDLGSIDIFDESGNPQNPISPNEFAFNLGYTRKLSEVFSGAVGLRYIRSDMYSGLEDAYPGNSFSADVAFFYNKEFRRNRKKSNMSYGVNISNIGNKISYDKGVQKDFIPTNLRIGAGYGTEIDRYNKIYYTIDFNKLLVPTLIEEEGDEEIPTGGISDGRGNTNANMGVIEGMFRSFGDAPGGIQEELQEVTVSLGLEYWYNNQFIVRGGYFHESENKGDRKYMTLGAGLRMNVLSLDFSYIYTISRQSPLENTLRFTLGLDLDNFSKQKGRR